MLWDGYNAFYRRHGDLSLPLEVTLTTWGRFFDAHEPMRALVAELAGEVVGLAHYLFHRSTISVQPVCYLQDLFVLEEARGQGVADAIISGLCDRVRGLGITRVYWQTHETNLTARRLYDRVAEQSGFIVYRRSP